MCFTSPSLGSPTWRSQRWSILNGLLKGKEMVCTWPPPRASPVSSPRSFPAENGSMFDLSSAGLAMDLCNKSRDDFSSPCFVFPPECTPVWCLGGKHSCASRAFCSSSCHRRVLLLRCREWARGDCGEVALASQRRPVAPGHRREERQAGQPAGGSAATADPQGPDRRPHAPGALQPAVCR